MASARVARSGTDKTVKTAEKTTTLESMLKLLLFLETELQFKEEILELLLEDERVNNILNEKIDELSKRKRCDPALALGRDSLYEKDTWDECFKKWRETSPPVEQVLVSNSVHLGATTAMRCVELAKVQLHRYKETYITLQKAAKGYKKIKQKLIKEKHRKSEDFSLDNAEAMSAAITELQEKNKLLYDKVIWERNRANNLENQLEQLNAVINRDRRKSGYIVKVLAQEIEQLSQQVQFYNERNDHNELPNGFHKPAIRDEGREETILTSTSVDCR
ncbi:uncharacterized protein LOC110252352 [Exaiptasia diaphana]|uniref:Cortactin-binding protein-2 N-terminal domain-containing protein n=1 Tax=Exaiptasia diaphana TaxID=2652724 RepID=A0A913Y5T1_EXADI|nr:uncharacterized protein LOC110252352 [Exaiptasia diaphana]KXJ29096.1 hypothetical protein AC249_AIPGENE1259 [Exaiptasia diaphana]